MRAISPRASAPAGFSERCGGGGGAASRRAARSSSMASRSSDWVMGGSCAGEVLLPYQSSRIDTYLLMNKMQAIVMNQPGGPEVLELRSLPLPELSSARHVRVRLHPAGGEAGRTKPRANGA